MKFLQYKYLTLIILSIGAYSDTELQEYKVEFIIFEYITPNTDEVFNSILEIPNDEIVNQYTLDKSSYSNFSNISIYISNIISKDFDKAKNLYPSIWYRDDPELEVLKNIETNITNDKDIKFIDSISWIQSIPQYESTKYLRYEDGKKNYGFFISLYQKRFMHIQLKGYISNLNSRRNNINIFIDNEKRIFNEEIHFFDNPYFGIIVSVRRI